MRLIFGLVFSIFFLCTNLLSKSGDDLGYVDEITINDREFSSLNDRDITFYFEDLKDGKIVIKGILESEDDSIDVKNLYVEITFDGGDSWSRAKGHEEWEWSFEPDLEKSYEFSLRVVKNAVATNTLMPIVVTTSPIVVKLYSYEPRVVNTEPIIVKLYTYEPRVVNTEPIIVKLHTYEPRVVNTEPIIVKLYTYEPRVVNTEPIIVKMKNYDPISVTTEPIIVQFNKIYKLK